MYITAFELILTNILLGSPIDPNFLKIRKSRYTGNAASVSHNVSGGNRFIGAPSNIAMKDIAVIITLAQKMFLLKTILFFAR